MRYVITGGSGYIGSRLVERLLDRPGTERVVVADVRPPRAFRPRLTFEELDVRDRAGARRLLERERPDALVHLAFVLNPIHDDAVMYEVDVLGTQNVLEAASAAGTGQVLVTTSATAYGAWPDNPVPIPEERPVRGVPDYAYASHKAECDRMCRLWSLEHPDRVMTIVRPSVVFGPTVDNFIVRLFTRQPFQADFGEPDVPFQLVHEDDLVEALALLLEGRHSGAFNVGADDWLGVSEFADIIGLPRRRVPLGLYTRLVQAAWRLRLSEAPAGQIRFARFPWVVANAKLRQTTGWRPRHGTRETFEITMRARGVLPGPGQAEAPGTGLGAGEKPVLGAPAGPA